ncbi:MAG: hypothetical protein M3P45_01035 [Acidobacteriota bacterium]|nr:hypothetical protein [Acidobacteriota bacterium]
MKIPTMLAAGILVASGLASNPGGVAAQEPAGAGTSRQDNRATAAEHSALTTDPHGYKKIVYSRPSEKTKFKNYLFDGYGPYPIMGAAIVAGINQADSTPPEWGGGAEAYGKRAGSNYGINIISTTTRYALSGALHQDTLYYRCQCKGFFPRLGHALVSTLAARHGEEGHYTFSVPALVAPYVGTLVATHTWYPGRYNASDGFRMGNYNLLALAGGNVALEFLYRGPHTFLSRIHLDNRHMAPEAEPDR